MAKVNAGVAAAMRTGTTKVKGTRINTVMRAADLLTLVASLPVEGRTASNLAIRLGTSIPTTHHTLSTLVDAGLLSRDDAKRYHLGVRIGILGESYRRENYVAPEISVQLQRLAAATGESVYYSVWREGTVEIVSRVAGSHAVQVANLGPGFEGQAHARASGKVLLAFADERLRDTYLALHALSALTPRTITDRHRLDNELESVRRRGYSVEDREFSPDVACIAVPVFVSCGLLGAYTISAPFTRYRQLRGTYLSSLRKAAADTTRAFDPEGISDRA